MSREVDTAEYMCMLRELIGQGHRVSVRVAGNSMSPFLKHGRDTVFFAAPDSEIKKGDIVFYTRPNGQYIMHRVCRVNPDGSLDISGDAQCVMECGVPMNTGVMVSQSSIIYRNGRFNVTYFISSMNALPQAASTAVAAPAFVPCSFTETWHLCSTRLT